MEGQTVSHYQVLERLGGGGMGVVYKARDTTLDRHVALKFLPPELTRDDDARRRFMQEAKAASALDHPNVCTIHEIASTPDDQLFIAMGYYEGEMLKQRIARGPLPVAAALDIIRQVAEGLAEAHAAGIVHRDIKPANIIVTKNGLVKILDFGIAKLTGMTGLTETGITLGTVSYMSPEQGVLGRALARAGQESEARRVLTELRDRSQREYVAPWGFAAVHQGLGELEEALDSLEMAYEEQSPQLIRSHGPEWDLLGEHPRFQDLFRRMGLPDPPAIR